VFTVYGLSTLSKYYKKRLIEIILNYKVLENHQKCNALSVVD